MLQIWRYNSTAVTPAAAAAGMLSTSWWQRVLAVGVTVSLAVVVEVFPLALGGKCLQ